MPESEITFSESVAVFEAMDRSTPASYDLVKEAVGKSRPDGQPSRSERTLRRIMKLTQALLDREANDLPLHLETHEWEQLQERVGYAASRNWLIEHTHWYLLWRKRRKESKLIVRFGFALLAAAAATLLGYVIYEIVGAMFTSDEIPIAVSIAIATGAVGFIVLILAVLRERIQAIRTEKLDEVEP